MATAEINTSKKTSETIGKPKLPTLIDNADDNLVSFIDCLQGIDSTKPIAKLNKTSIADNNGGRILL